MDGNHFVAISAAQFSSEIERAHRENPFENAHIIRSNMECLVLSLMQISLRNKETTKKFDTTQQYPAKYV